MESESMQFRVGLRGVGGEGGGVGGWNEVRIRLMLFDKSILFLLQIIKTLTLGHLVTFYHIPTF